MTEELRDLFLSENMEDVELAFILARKLDISPTFLFEGAFTLYEAMLFPYRIRLVRKYIKGNGINSRWKSEEETNNIII